MTMFRHCFSFNFALYNGSQYCEVPLEELRQEILSTLNKMTDKELAEHCGAPWSYEIKEEDKA